MYKHILLPYDGSEVALAAEKECIALAKVIGAKVTAIQVVCPRNLSSLEDGAPLELVRRIENGFDNLLTGPAHRTLAEVQARASAKGIECDTVVALGGAPYKEIIEHAVKTKCDLILMGSHGRTSLGALLYGSQTVKVLSHSSIPVLVVRAG